MEGLITTIQRMSVHDGPGIRSTIFLKGCNLSCAWCHNPETISFSPELEWISSKCINCHACVPVCPTDALSVQNGLLNFQKSECNACFNCIAECYPEALNKIGRKVSAEDLFNEIVPDFPFFRQSGGGITISGGEPMLQKEFTAELLRLFHAAGIHTALDTNMMAKWEDYETVFPNTDLVLSDLKLIDSDLHKKFTGQGNKRILENIMLLDQTGISYYLRTPVVPGINDNEPEMNRIVEFVSRLKNYKKFELLPFHSLGSFKYENLGIANPMDETMSLTKNDLQRFDKILERFNVKR